eukprot:4224508-Pleurochrysis_carterae.AAC.3
MVAWNAHATISQVQAHHVTSRANAHMTRWSSLCSGGHPALGHVAQRARAEPPGRAAGGARTYLVPCGLGPGAASVGE